MNLTPTDLAGIATVTLAAIVMAVQDDPRWLRWLRRRQARKNILPPPDHTCRRDINTGNWSSFNKTSR